MFLERGIEFVVLDPLFDVELSFSERSVGCFVSFDDPNDVEAVAAFDDFAQFANRQIKNGFIDLLQDQCPFARPVVLAALGCAKAV